MKRELTDVLRRGFDNALANWQLVLIRVAETAVAFGIAIAAVLAVVVPVVVSVRFGKWDLKDDPAAAWQTILAIVTDHWMLWIYLLLVVCAVLAVVLAIHAAVEAGSARVYLDAERAAAISRTQTRERFEVFDMDRFLAGVREGWWRVFWIYNIAWTYIGMLVLAPLLFGALIVSAIGANPAALLLGCLVVLSMLVFMAFAAVLGGIWVERAIVTSLDRGLGANAALRESRSWIREDITRHVGLALIVIVISIFGSGALSAFSSGIPFRGHSLDWQLLLMSPLVLASSFLQTAFSSAVASWFLASVAAIQQENPS